MKPNLLISFILLFFTQNTFGQLKIIDSNNEPIANAHIIVNDTKQGITSNLDGTIPLSELLKSYESDSSRVTIQHIAYQNMDLTIGDLKSNTNIVMSERPILLNDISVYPSSKYDYIVIKGFFRSYQQNNSIFKYYTDGVIEYYIPKKGNQLRFKVTEYRSFRNKILVDKELKESSGVIMKLASIPHIEIGTLFDEIKSKYKLADAKFGKNIILEDYIVGTIKEDTAKNIVHIEIDKIAPKKEKTYVLMGNISKIKNITISEIYLINTNRNIAKYHLESRKEYRKLYFLQKKSNEEELIESVHDFYATEIKYITKKEFKSVNAEKDTSLRESHLYHSEYWSDMIEKYHIPPLNPLLEMELNKTLIMY
ncbi:hypothetical protein MASR2M117_24460 [Paludibacter sp.]